CESFSAFFRYTMYVLDTDVAGMKGVLDSRECYKIGRGQQVEMKAPQPNSKDNLREAKLFSSRWGDYAVTVARQVRFPDDPRDWWISVADLMTSSEFAE